MVNHLGIVCNCYTTGYTSAISLAQPLTQAYTTDSSEFLKVANELSTDFNFLNRAISKILARRRKAVCRPVASFAAGDNIQLGT